LWQYASFALTTGADKNRSLADCYGCLDTTPVRATCAIWRADAYPNPDNWAHWRW